MKRTRNLVAAAGRPPHQAIRGVQYLRQEITAWLEGGAVFLVICIIGLLVLGLPVIFLRLLWEGLIRMITW